MFCRCLSSVIELLQNLERKFRKKREEHGSPRGTSSEERLWIDESLSCKMDEVYAEMQGGEILPEKADCKGKIV